MRFRSSAFDHGITRNQIEEVLASIWGMTKWFAIHDDEDGNSQDMAVGFDADGNGLEIGISYIDDDEVIFHADTMAPAWQSEYNKG
jgi:hypothetical protein